MAWASLPRRRDLGRQRARPRARSSRACRSRCTSSPSRSSGRGPSRSAGAEFGIPGRPLRIHLLVQLLEHLRAEEPARPDRGVLASVRAERRPGARAEDDRRQRATAANCATCTRAAARRGDVIVLEQGLPAERYHGLVAALRRLRLAAPGGGIRPDDRRGDGARQAGRRDRILGQSRVHDRREQLPGAGRHRADPGRPRAVRRRRLSGPSPSSTPRRRCCGGSSNSPRRHAPRPSRRCRISPREHSLDVRRRVRPPPPRRAGRASRDPCRCRGTGRVRADVGAGSGVGPALGAAAARCAAAVPATLRRPPAAGQRTGARGCARREDRQARICRAGGERRNVGLSRHVVRNDRRVTDVRTVAPPVFDPSPSRWRHTGAGTLFFVGNVAHDPQLRAIEWLATRPAPELEAVDRRAEIRIIGDARIGGASLASSKHQLSRAPGRRGCYPRVRRARALRRTDRRRLRIEDQAARLLVPCDTLCRHPRRDDQPALHLLHPSDQPDRPPAAAELVVSLLSDRDAPMKTSDRLSDELSAFIDQEQAAGSGAPRPEGTRPVTSGDAIFERPVWREPRHQRSRSRGTGRSGARRSAGTPLLARRSCRGSATERRRGSPAVCARISSSDTIGIPVPGVTRPNLSALTSAIASMSAESKPQNWSRTLPFVDAP